MVQKISNSNNVDEIEESIKRTLQKEISGEVRFDEITREIYSTDASIYRMLPLCVVIPKNTNDVKTYISVLFKSFNSFISELAILPKITRL